MREDDFKGVFGPTPAGFKRSVNDTLGRLEDRNVKSGRVKIKALLVVALAVLLAGTALAITRSSGAGMVLRFPMPENAELDEFEHTSGFERWQFGKTVMSTWRFIGTRQDKTIEDHLAEIYAGIGGYEGYEAFQMVDVGGYTAECGRFTRLFEEDGYPHLSVFLKTEEADYLILIDCSSNDPEAEEIESWMSGLKFVKAGSK